MKLDEDFSELELRIILNIKTRNLYFKTFNLVKNMVHNDLLMLQSKDLYVTEDMYKSEIRKVNDYLDVYSDVKTINKVIELFYYFGIIIFAGLCTNLLRSFLALRFMSINISSFIIYICLFTALIVSPLIIYRKERKMKKSLFKKLLVGLSVFVFLIFSYFSITSGPIKQNIASVNLILYFLTLGFLYILLFALKKLSKI